MTETFKQTFKTVLIIVIITALIFFVFYYNSRSEIRKLDEYIRKNDIKNVQDLLDDGLDPNYNSFEMIIKMMFGFFTFPILMIVSGSSNGYSSPLFKAVDLKNWEIVDILLKHGAKDDTSGFKSYLEDQIKEINDKKEQTIGMKNEEKYYQILLNYKIE